MQDLEEGPKKNKVTNNNALFVGSTAELSKLLKQGLKDINENFSKMFIVKPLTTAVDIQTGS